MADYRDWCDVCHAETNFGSHEPGCPVPARIEASRKEFEWRRQKKKENEERPFRGLDPEELFETLCEIESDIATIREELDPLEAKRDGAYRVLNEYNLTFKFLEYRRAKRDALEV